MARAVAAELVQQFRLDFIFELIGRVKRIARRCACVDIAAARRMVSSS